MKPIVKRIAFFIVVIIALLCVMAVPATQKGKIRLKDDFQFQGVHEFELVTDKHTRNFTVSFEHWQKGSSEVIFEKDFNNIEKPMPLTLTCLPHAAETGYDFMSIQLDAATEQISVSEVLEFNGERTPSAFCLNLLGDTDQGKWRRVSPEKDVILACYNFDMGRGVSAYSTETLISEPERLAGLENAVICRLHFEA